MFLRYYVAIEKWSLIITVMNEGIRQRHKYHIYIDLFGEESLFQPLYDFLQESKAVKLASYPIWHFTSQENKDFYIHKLSEILKAIPVKNEGLGLVETRWTILLMHSNGHNGFSRGITPEQYEKAFNKHSLPDDVLQNPEGHIPLSQTSRIGMQEKQSYLLSQLQSKPSNFFTEFSLKELVKKNNSTTGLLCAKRTTGGVGFGSSGGNSEQTIHNNYETFGCWISDVDSDKFDEEELVSSLRNDVEDTINQSGLKITENNSLDLSSFRFKYESSAVKGQIDISGEMKNGYYEIKANVVEKDIQKIE